MAAPGCGPWNSRDLIPPPTNFLKINLARLSDEESHSHDDLKSALYSIQNGRDLNGSLLKRELVTLSRFLYKNKNSQRNWKLYGLLVKLKKCLERLANTAIHSYAETMLSAWDGFPDLSTPVISLPSRQMLEYLCVGLQGCTKLCAYIASQCEQAALLMIETIHNGMFLSSSLVFLAIVSRIRVLICNFFKSAVGWYDNLVTVRSFLPSTSSEWLPKGTELPGTLLEWLGDEASRLTLDVTSSKNASELSLLDRLFNTSLEVSLDMTEGGEREVTAISQLLMSTGLEVKRDMKDGEERAVTAVSQQPSGTGLEIRMDAGDVGEQDVTKDGQQTTGFGLEVKMDMRDAGEREVTKVGQQPTGTGLEIRMDMRDGGGREVTAVVQQPTDNNLMVRMDTKAKGEREVTVSCQQSKRMPATLPDLGEKLSQAEVAFLMRDRRKQGYHQLNPDVVSTKENENAIRKNDNGRMNSPPRKRRKTKLNTSEFKSEEGQFPKVFKQKVMAKGVSSRKGWPMKKLGVGSVPKYSSLGSNTPSISTETKRTKKRSKGKGLASSILTTVSVQRGKVHRRTSTSRRVGVPSIRRSVSQESSSDGQSRVSRNTKRGVKLQHCIAKMKHRKKSRSDNSSSDSNSLVIKNSALSCTPSSAFSIPRGYSKNNRSGDKTFNPNSLPIRNTAAPHVASSTYDIDADRSSHSLRNCRNHPELFMSSPTNGARSYEGKKSRTSMSSATQKPTLDTSGYSHKTRSTGTKEKGLPCAILPHSRYEPSRASTKQSSLVNPGGTVSSLGFKKKKLVKRLKKLKQKLIGKGRTAPDSSLHYTNQMSISRSTPLQIQQQQHFNLQPPRNQCEHHGESSEPRYHHHGNKHPQSHHYHGSRTQPHYHQGNRQQKDIPHKKHPSKKMQQPHPLPPSNHNLSQRTSKKKRQKSHAQQGLVLNQKRENHKRKTRDTDHDMDSIFASLL
ncbi:uncharacterized protein LOC121418841 [Lytechinus variegatus]|uniref:uncharacterized protein LOC121418841 n=1 Tax=Lytechinus variegatus TaxID=7654 RepID=UPI001BB1EB78|nr:uncharacterized protein LOC121418841 [Lytechinus variegatus]